MERWRILHKEKDYTVIDNGIFRDSDLSLAERGFLCTVMSLPDDWAFSTSGMADVLHESLGTIKAVINRLVSHGYCKKGRIFDPKTGRIVGYEYSFLEVKNGLGCVSAPQTKNPAVENPQMESPAVENCQQLSTEENQVLKESSTERGTPARTKFTPPSMSDVMEYFRANRFQSSAGAFHDHFAQNGWRSSGGRGPVIKDWKAAARNWERRMRSGEFKQ